LSCECTCRFVKRVTDDGVDLQSVKAYLRRGTAREFVGNYKGANEGQKHLPPALAVLLVAGFWVLSLVNCLLINNQMSV
jgi:hypothetical protein